MVAYLVATILSVGPPAMISKTLESVRRLLGLDSAAVSEEDRRIWGRISCDRVTHCSAAGQTGAQLHPIQVRNISAGGIGFLSPTPYHPGLLVSIYLPPAGEGESLDERTVVLACVVRCDPKGEQFEVGCTFAGVLDEEDLARFGAGKTPTTPPDKRQWVRYDCKGEAYYQVVRTADSGRMLRATLRNISAGGLSMAVEEVLPVGELLSLELHRDHEVIITTLASVVRTEQGPDGERVVACNFIRALNEAVLAQLA
jgi:c-di-GMP-binding flagellar brake protein YcgR